MNHWLWEMKQVTALSGLHAGVESCFMFQLPLSHKILFNSPPFLLFSWTSEAFCIKFGSFPSKFILFIRDN